MDEDDSRWPLCSLFWKALKKRIVRPRQVAGTRQVQCRRFATRQISILMRRYAVLVMRQARQDQKEDDRCDHDGGTVGGSHPAITEALPHQCQGLEITGTDSPATEPAPEDGPSPTDATI